MIEYVMLHRTELLLLIPSVIGVCSIIVKLTPTLKDDAILAKVVKVLEACSLTSKVK